MVFDNNGTRAPAAVAYFYQPDTTTPLTVYQDADESTTHAHPVVADGNGRWPQVFIPYGSYREVIKTSGGTTLSTGDDIPNPEPTNPTDTVDATQLLTTGEVFFKFADATRTGAVRANGRTMGNAASGATERANADTVALFTELYNALTDTYAPVSGGRGAGAAADYAANKTITLPDLRGRAPWGLDTMGNVAGSRFNAAVPFATGSAIIAGSNAGLNHHSITTAESAAHTHTGVTTSDGNHTHTLTGATAASNGAHTHTVNITDPGHVHGSSVAQVTGGAFQISGGANTTVANTASATTGITAATVSDGAHVHTLTGTTDGDGVHTHSFTTASTGGAGAHNNLPGVILGTWFIKL
jgi:hypothetical protein